MEAVKSILSSKRANLYYLEHCRVMQKDGRVLYLTESQKESQYFNIPIANTTFILLGTGTSITQAAVRLLASAGVVIGFCGGGGTPLLMSTEIEWLTPQSEYRPTEYLQGWLAFWFDESARHRVAIQLQELRLEYLQSVWGKESLYKKYGLNSKNELSNMIELYTTKIRSTKNVTELLLLEAEMTKKLYRIAASKTHQSHFKRQHDAQDKANAFLNHGNYLAYGLAATALWVLGIPHGFAVMHGKTRRGALVFDIADLIKDAVILPTAFIMSYENESEQSFRKECIRLFTDHRSLEYMFKSVKGIAL